MRIFIYTLIKGLSQRAVLLAMVAADAMILHSNHHVNQIATAIVMIVKTASARKKSASVPWMY